MCKSNKKHSKYNAFAVNKIAEKYGYTPRYIRQCLSGSRGGVMAVRIVEDYILMKNEIEKATNKIVNKV